MSEQLQVKVHSIELHCARSQRVHIDNLTAFIRGYALQGKNAHFLVNEQSDPSFLFSVF